MQRLTLSSVVLLAGLASAAAQTAPNPAPNPAPSPAPDAAPTMPAPGATPSSTPSPAPSAMPSPAPGPAPSAQAPAPVAPVQGQPATLSDNLRPTFVAQAPEDMVATRIISASVVNGANETVGQIADFVLGPGGGIKAWVVGVGGFLGLGTKYVAVDPSALKLTRVDDKTLQARIDTTKDQLRAAPEYIYLGKDKPN